jgi:hypothetical protein
MARKTHVERLASAYQLAIMDSQIAVKQAVEADWNAASHVAALEALGKESAIGRRFLLAWKQATATKLPRPLMVPEGTKGVVASSNSGPAVVPPKALPRPLMIPEGTKGVVSATSTGPMIIPAPAPRPLP